MGAVAVLGWDMGTALAMAQALGLDPLIAAECLPEIEAVMVRKVNEQLASGNGERGDVLGQIMPPSARS